MENTTHEYAGTRIASGGNTNITAGERDLTVNGSTIEGKDMSLTAKGNVRLEAGENTSITTTENKFSSASIGASFTPQGLSNISINANKANGNSKESVTAYSPTLISAANNLSLTSGGDMDIIGSRAQGEKITAKVEGTRPRHRPDRQRHPWSRCRESRRRKCRCRCICGGNRNEVELSSRRSYSAANRNQY